MMNRRDFLSHTAAAGAGLTLGFPALARMSSPFSLAAGALATGAHLTPILLVDDALRLALLDPAVDADVKAMMIEHRAFARAAGVLPATAAEIVDLLADVRDGWAERDGLPVVRHAVNGDMREPKLAVAAGWLAHHSAHDALYGDAPPEGIDDRALYHDVTLLHALHDSEPVPPADPSASVDELARLLQMMYLRTYIRMHTIDPDFDEVEPWILRLVAWHRDLEPLTRRYARAYLQPDPALVRRYVEEPGFYNPDDLLIRLARTLHQGIANGPVDVAQAASSSAEQSRYARALGRAYRTIKAVGDFHAGHLHRADLERHLQG